MNDYNQFGYLGKDAGKWFEVKKLNHDQLYKLAIKFNEFAHPLLYKLNINNRNVQEIITSVLFYRALGVYQGILIFIQRGMFVESKYLIRVLLEIKYKIICVAKDKKHADDFAMQDLYVRKKRIKDYSLWSDELKKKNKPLDVESLETEVNQTIKEYELDYHNTKWYAQEAGLLDDFCTAWVTLSGEIHVSIRELENDFIIENDDIKSFKIEPRIDEFKPLLEITINSMIRIVNSLQDVFDLEIENYLKESISEFNRICNHERFK